MASGAGHAEAFTSGTLGLAHGTPVFSLAARPGRLRSVRWTTFRQTLTEHRSQVRRTAVTLVLPAGIWDSSPGFAE